MTTSRTAEDRWSSGERFFDRKPLKRFHLYHWAFRRGEICFANIRSSHAYAEQQRLISSHNR